MTDKVFGPNATTEEVYDVAARPVVKTAMDGINGMINLNFRDLLIGCLIRM